jgi:hypothetical protein
MTSVLPVIRIQLEVMIDAAASPRNSRLRTPQRFWATGFDIPASSPLTEV